MMALLWLQSFINIVTCVVYFQMVEDFIQKLHISMQWNVDKTNHSWSSFPHFWHNKRLYDKLYNSTVVWSVLNRVQYWQCCNITWCYFDIFFFAGVLYIPAEINSILLYFIFFLIKFYSNKLHFTSCKKPSSV